MSGEIGKTGKEFDALVESIGEITFRLGFEAMDDDAEDFEIALDEWLSSAHGLAMQKLCKKADVDDDAELRLEEILSEACAEFAHIGPARPTTALCVVVLAHAIDRIGQYGHLHQVKRALLRCIYANPRTDAVGDGSLGGAEDVEEDAYAIENLGGLTEFMHATPHFEIARVLRPKAKALLHQREMMVEAKANADERKARRKQAVIRTTMRWQNNLRHHFFTQWMTTVKHLKAQRISLLKHFQTKHTKSVGDIFKAWRAWLVSERLERFMNERENLAMNLDNLKHGLIDAKETNATMNENLVEQKQRYADAEQKLKETLEAIYQQRHPETMALVKSLATTLLDSINVVILELKRLLDWCAASPSVIKLAKIYWVDREELKAKQEEAEKMAKEAEIAEQNEILKATKAAKAEKRRKKQESVANNKAEAAMQSARDRVETEWKEQLAARQAAGEPIGELTIENMKVAMEEAAKTAGREVMDEAKKAWAKEDYLLEEKELQNKLKLMEQAKKNDADFKHRMSKKDNTMKESDIDEALQNIPQYPQDRFLLRWIKYTLRRSTRHGYPYRRKCLNFGNDLRDGVTYTVIMRNLAPEVWPGDHFGKDEKESLDFEIDPQTRIDAVMDMLNTIRPRATGFITRGHILGFDQFLNAVLLTRLFLTRPHNLGEIFVKKARKQLASVREQWKETKVTIEALCAFKSWKMIRSKNSDEELDSVLSSIQVISANVSNIQESIWELRERATQGRKAWAMVYRRMDSFLSTLFSVKTLQEDHAEQGNTPDVEKGEAPIMMADYRHEKKFLTYTVTKRDRIKSLMDSVNQIHLVAHEKNLAMKEEPPRELTDEEIAAIKCPLMRQEDAEQEVADIEQILRQNYVDLKKIFEYYAAGGEGGAPTDISEVEWIGFCTDCKFADKTETVSTDDFHKIFDATDDGVVIEEIVWSESETEDDTSDEEGDEGSIEEAADAAQGEEGTDPIGAEEEGEEEVEEEEEEPEYKWELDEDERNQELPSRTLHNKNL